jgi:hypothetical protein
MLTVALALLAQAEEPKEEVYRRIGLGDRVEVTFNSGRTVIGTLVTPPQGQKAESIDYAKEKSLTLDLGLEYPGLSGTLTVRKDEIRTIRTLRQLSEKDRKAAEEARRILEEARKAAEAEKPKEKDKDAEAERKRKAQEDSKKGEALYRKFPPPDWGPDRAAAIRLKQLTGGALLPAEKEFLNGFELWDLYRRTAVEPKKKPDGK